MDKLEYYRQLARLEGEMEDAFMRHDYDNYWYIKTLIVELEQQNDQSFN